MSADPTAAERARRYRARRRDRDASVTSRDPELVAVLGRIEQRIGELAELIRGTYPHSGPAVDNRDVTARHAAQRDVTERHGAEGARVAPARMYPSAGPYGALADDGVASRVTDHGIDPLARVLAALEGRSAHSIRALADALDETPAEIARALVELARLGRAQRIAGELPGEPDHWQLVVVESPSETIACSAYLEHQLGHRRDPLSGRFRCYICSPDGTAEQLVVDLSPASPA